MPYSPYHRPEREQVINCCPRCARRLNESGVCSRCSSQRIVAISAILCVGFPVLGFGACLLLAASGDWLAPFAFLGLGMMAGGPIVGVLYFLISLVNRRSRK